MKTTYQKPATDIILLTTKQLVMASPVENGFNTGTAEETEQTSGNLSRHFSVWGDDEDEY